MKNNENYPYHVDVIGPEMADRTYLKKRCLMF